MGTGEAGRSTPLERGVWGILATPFDGADAVDVDSMQRQIEFFSHAGARVVVALGVFGEAARLDASERRAVGHAALSSAAEHGLGTGHRADDHRP